jgi:hypothetical protein
VRIFGPQYVHGKKIDLFDKKKIQRTVLMMVALFCVSARDLFLIGLVC